MGLIALPYNPQPGQVNDVTQVMAIVAAILAECNGDLDSVNIATAAPPNPLDGDADAVGTTSAIARAGHTHTIRGMERLTADPATGNKIGREYFNTVTFKKRLCIDVGGSGTWVTTGNVSPTDLVAHSPQHVDGGHDPMPDNFLTDHMKAARTIQTATLAATVGSISTSAYTDIVDLAASTTGIQTLLVTVTVKATNTLGNKPRVNLRVVDVTNANATIWASMSHQLGISGAGSDSAALCYSFVYNVPAGGARTLRLQASADATGLEITKPGSFHSEATLPPTLSAVVI